MWGVGRNVGCGVCCEGYEIWAVGLWGCGLMDVGWEVRGVGMWGVGYESIEEQH